MTSRLRSALLGGCVCLLLAGGALRATHAEFPRQAPPPAPRPVDLLPTAHPPLPADPATLWLVPDAAWRPSPADGGIALRALTDAADLIARQKWAQALPIAGRPGLASTPLADYALYLRGLAEQGLGRTAQARETFAAIRARKPVGALAQDAPLREAEAAEAAGDYAAAVALYETLASEKAVATDTVLARLAAAAVNAGDRARAVAAYSRLFYQYPLSDLASQPPAGLSDADLGPLGAGNARYKADLARAELLFSNRRWPRARDAFEALRPWAAGDDGELVPLRIAECDQYLRRYQQARDGTRPFIDSASRRVEAFFFHLTATRELGAHDEYVRMARRLIDDYPDSSWAEEALNNLASHFIIEDEDDRADDVFHELVAKFPSGRYAARAGWKIGWWAYKHSRYEAAATHFEQTAAAFPRSDYRPPCLYWAAKSRERLKDAETAMARYRVVVADYANSYYGRLAAGILRAKKAPLELPGDPRPSIAEPSGLDTDTPVPTGHLIRLLISLKLYAQALDEVRYAERSWGESSALLATRAWLLNRTGDLRPGITAMRRAYPQFMAAGGEKLPRELLAVIFPVDYWTLLKKYADAHRLDPYLVTALAAQESTFDTNAKSGANAIGIMQILPSTGRRYARKLGIRGFSTNRLTVPEVNIRIGTAFFADLVRRFGGVHYALASYNAGEYRVAQWMAERPGLDRDEFIDDIPFPETQNYLKRILGTAEDYRWLYGRQAGERRTANDYRP